MLNFSKGSRQGTVTLFALLFAMGLVVGGVGSFYLNSHSSTTLNNEVAALKTQVATLSASQNQTINSQLVTIIQNGTNLPDLYSNVTNSVVLVHGTATDGEVEGSGFVYNYSGQMVIVTNFHVIYGVTGLSVTFSDGNGYSAKVLGKDAYADLAVLSVNAPASEFMPLSIVSSSTLRIGDEAIACSFVTGKYYAIRGTGAYIVGAITNAPISERVLVRAIQARFPEEKNVAADVRALVAELLREGVLERYFSDDLDHEPLIEGAYGFQPIDVRTELADILVLDPIHDVAPAGWPERR